MHKFSACKVTLSRCRLLMWLLACSLGASAQSLPTLQLQLDDATPNDGGVHFRISSCDIEAAPSAQNLQQMSQGTGTTKYTLFADIGSTSLFYNSFIYVFYVAPLSTIPPAQMCVFRVQATPSGVFVDQMKDVTFHLKEGAQYAEDGTVSIPLHNTSYKQPILRAEPPTPFASVSLSGKYPVAVKITNLLNTLPVTITGVTATPENPGYWQVSPPQADLHFSQSNATALQPGQSLDTGIEVTLVPNAFHAMSGSIFPIAPGQAQEKIHLSIAFSTPGGIPGTLEVPLALRFKPSFWNLALAVFIGALVGSGIGLLLKKNPSPAWYQAVPVALGLGIIAEALGMVLVAGNSEFRLLGFELDPYQLLPASLVGVLIGLLGFRSADDFLKLFKKGGP
jgi:hypothetical protein